MAGHSKWANIKHRKGAQDKKKAILFSKCSKAIMAAVRQGGPDPDMNLTLTYAIEKARASNMPREKIERAIQAAAGGGSGQDFAHVMYEGYGPGGVALMVESLTDNRHRTAPEMKKLFEKGGGNLGATGCVGAVIESRRRAPPRAAPRPHATEVPPEPRRRAPNRLSRAVEQGGDGADGKHGSQHTRSSGSGARASVTSRTLAVVAAKT